MDDIQIWSFERSLWTSPVDRFRGTIDEACLIVIPFPPYMVTGKQAIEAVSDTPRWRKIEIAHGRIARPEEGIIVVAYRATARRAEGEDYAAWCSSTYRRRAHENWRLVQHQQTIATDEPGSS